jgi:hypothetical protein
MSKNKTDALCAYLKNNHTGQINAAPSKTLEAVFHLSGREIRECINSLRCKDFPICSDSVGYYYAATTQEINETVAQLNNRITKISNARNGLLKASSKLNTPAHITVDIKMTFS